MRAVGEKEENMVAIIDKVDNMETVHCIEINIFFLR